jgi:hypothetical protein
MAAIKNAVKEEIAFKALDLVESIATTFNEFSLNILRGYISGAESDDMFNFINREIKMNYPLVQHQLYDHHITHTPEADRHLDQVRLRAIDEKMATSLMCCIMAYDVVRLLKFDTNVNARKKLSELKAYLNAYKNKPGTLFFDKSVE